MSDKKFDPKKLKKLNNPDRLKDIPPTFIWEKLGLNEPEVMVDIGAGTAFFSIAFLAKSPRSTVYACDISKVMINWMEENIVPQYPNIIPVQMEEKSIPLEDSMADLVFMINLHHELDAPDATVKDAYRLLKPSGKIAIIDWKKQEMAEGPPERIRCLPSEVKDTLEINGFTNISVSEELGKHFIVLGEKN